MADPQISVVVPTYQRRELVYALLEALRRQTFDGRFEVVVVIDGSTDGTVEALANFDGPFAFKVIVQQNQGSSRARNRGAASATGEILMFLDDDMEPDPHLLDEHLRSHLEGADAVLGSLPLHPDSPDNLLAQGVRSWAEEMARRLMTSGHSPAFDDVVSGQLSVRRSLFEELGGFDERFTRQGAYGAEDVEFGYRLIEGGHRIVFNPAAISRQRYVVDAATHLRQYRQVGQADVAIVRKYSELSDRTFRGKRELSEIHRLVWKPVLAFPRLASLLTAPVRRFVVRRVDHGQKDQWTARLFFGVRAVEYWLGVGEAGGIPRLRPITVLCYHAIADLTGDPILEQHGVSPATFRDHLDLLVKFGYHFVDPVEFLRFLEEGGGLPSRPVFLTFDDCYADLRETVAPLLAERGVSAAVFAVTGLLGATNEWDQAAGSRSLRLLDATDLRSLSERGFEIGSHTRSHQSLKQLNDAGLDHEVAGSFADLDELGLGGLRFFAYPYGDQGARERAAVAHAGARVAFTVDPGKVRAGGDVHRVARIEIQSTDIGWRFWWKVRWAGGSVIARAQSVRRSRSR